MISPVKYSKRTVLIRVIRWIFQRIELFHQLSIYHPSKRHAGKVLRFLELLNFMPKGISIHLVGRIHKICIIPFPSIFLNIWKVTRRSILRWRVRIQKRHSSTHIFSSFFPQKHCCTSWNILRIFLSEAQQSRFSSCYLRVDWPLSRVPATILDLPLPKNIYALHLVLSFLGDPSNANHKRGWNPDRTLGQLALKFHNFLGYWMARRCVPQAPHVWLGTPLINKVGQIEERQRQVR